MKLKSILISGLFISILSMFMLSYAFLHISQQYAHTTKQSETINKLYYGVLELNVLTVDYLLYKNQRPFEQWLKRHNSLHQLITENISLLPDKYSAEMFSKLSNSHKLILNLKKLNSTQSVSFNTELVTYQIQALSSQLQTIVQSMSSSTHHFTDQQHHYLDQITLNLKRTILIIIFSLGLITFIIVYIFMSRIYRPIKYLNQNIKHFFPNLTFRLKLKHNDELGNLAKAMNKMAEKIQNTMYERDLMTYKAQHDPLTGLANRLLCIDRLNQVQKLAARNNTMIAIIFIDLDNFKNINDHYGHHAGDEVLKHVAKCIQLHIRNTDNLARIGGDELMLILSGISERIQIDEIVNNIREELSTPLQLNNERIKIGLSLGVSVYPGDSQNIDKLISYADKAMYCSKQLGGNTFCYYTEDM